MARRIAYRGAKFQIGFAREATGSCPGCDFFDVLGELDRAKMFSLFKIAAEHGDFSNPDKFGDLGDGLFEFKSFQLRMPFAYSRKERGMILITHGFIKKTNRTQKQEIARARRILQEDQQLTGLKIVQKARK